MIQAYAEKEHKSIIKFNSGNPVEGRKLEDSHPLALKPRAVQTQRKCISFACSHSAASTAPPLQRIPTTNAPDPNHKVAFFSELLTAQSSQDKSHLQDFAFTRIPALDVMQGALKAADSRLHRCTAVLRALGAQALGSQGP